MTVTARLLAIDPGLDDSAYCVIQIPDHRPDDLRTLGPRIEQVERWPTGPEHGSDGDRVAYLGALLRALMARTTIDRVVLEVPAMYTPYAARGPDRGRAALKQARAMACLWWVIGTYQATALALGVPVVRLAPTGCNEPIVRALWPQRTNAHERDAIWLAVRYLTDGRHWARPAGRIARTTDDVAILGREIDRLRTAVGELQLDRDRLDWLTEHLDVGCRFRIGLGDDAIDVEHDHVAVHLAEALIATSSETTLRAALDAAKLAQDQRDVAFECPEPPAPC